MNILGEESEVNEEIKTNFFESLKNENLTEIIKYFRNEEIKVWTYKEEEELSALHRASFMNLTLVVCAMIDENYGLVTSTTGSTYCVRVLSTINREDLKTSASVALLGANFIRTLKVVKLQ